MAAYVQYGRDIQEMGEALYCEVCGQSYIRTFGIGIFENGKPVVIELCSQECARHYAKQRKIDLVN